MRTLPPLDWPFDATVRTFSDYPYHTRMALVAALTRVAYSQL
jgi:hypothetical protein